MRVRVRSDVIYLIPNSKHIIEDESFIATAFSRSCTSAVRTMAKNGQKNFEGKSTHPNENGKKESKRKNEERNLIYVPIKSSAENCFASSNGRR